MSDATTAALCGLVRVVRLESTLLLSMATPDLLDGLERVTRDSDIATRQITNAVDAVITSALYR